MYSFDDLTDEQKQEFARIAESFGLEPTKDDPYPTTCENLETSDETPEVVLAHGETEAIVGGRSIRIAPETFVIRDVTHMKELVGKPDSTFDPGGPETDRHLDYPEMSPQVREAYEIGNTAAFEHRPKCAMDDLLGRLDKREIKEAMAAFVHGDSRRLADYEAVINAMHFPMTVSVHSVQELIVHTGHIKTLGDPNTPGQVFNFGVVTVYKGGEIQLVNDATLISQMMVQEDSEG